MKNEKEGKKPNKKTVVTTTETSHKPVPAERVYDPNNPRVAEMCPGGK
ncbi:hypothetical protein KKE45_03185 [Patescibacteria group bacterium]|nr:hypothetical protein [Patescibacteria group bacterium]